ncbi:uncharacterized protein SCHCODRAFT_02603968 [Schizophyllum commune H4-8]|uniref:uncharacterized protein n=1 Tax=Schizophyllum commune (strain H4-8 / FGSC 9210) TaxID=578458 RepID=UPI00215F46AC|nr:uncharacterized protein SCHCODRAFT_02603968 [Schizophyllum commune H4-8]KAI5899024.1 hypothetical protein SCHCODRAFT_02603968 [Schizophyllum commune H4-8]
MRWRAIFCSFAHLRHSFEIPRGAAVREIRSPVPATSKTKAEPRGTMDSPTSPTFPSAPGAPVKAMNSHVVVACTPGRQSGLQTASVMLQNPHLASL